MKSIEKAVMMREEPRVLNVACRRLLVCQSLTFGVGWFCNLLATCLGFQANKVRSPMDIRTATKTASQDMELPRKSASMFRLELRSIVGLGALCHGKRPRAG